MREIKFRAWNKEKNVMVYKNEDDSDEYWDGVCASDIEVLNNILSSELTSETYNFMQYTGLKDTNSNEIYEGDIVKIKSAVHENALEYIGEVIFDNGAYMCKSKWNIHYLGDLFLNREILGNIYENKSLL